MDIYYDFKWFDKFIKNYKMNEEEKLNEQNFVLLMASCLALQAECWTEAFIATKGLKQEVKMQLNSSLSALRSINKYFDLQYKNIDKDLYKIHFEASVTFDAILRKIYECPEEKTQLLELLKAYSEGTLKIEQK